jgi:hypothetical protein
MKIRRLLVTLSLLPIALGGMIGSAGASPPVRGCPPSFTGPLTFQAIIAMFPPPPGFPDPEGALSVFDLNEDGKLCVRPHPDEVRIIVIDNVASTAASQD